jgi:hypothetical protein
MSTEVVVKEVWGVLVLSFCVDGYYIFGKTVQEMLASRRIDGDGINKDMSFGNMPRQMCETQPPLWRLCWKTELRV